MSALAMHKRATQKDKEEKISKVFYEERLIPIPVNHRLSKTASLWKIDRRGWDETLNSEWTIKPHDYSPHHRAREKLSTDELYELIFLQPREPTEREKQQMVVRMESELAEFMRKPHESTFPDDTHDKCQKTLSQVLEFLEHKYNTVYSQLGRDMNDKRNKKPKAKPKLSSSFKIGKKRCPPGCVKKKASRKTSRKRRSVKRKTSRKRRSVKRKASRKRRSVKRKASRKRKSVKRSRKKVIGGKMRTIHKSKNPVPYDEDWAKGFVTHIGPGGGGGRNNYTGAKKVPTRRILDARKKLIDKIYLLHDQLVALDSSLVKNMFTGVVSNPTEWRDPPQYMDRDVLKYYVEMMKADVKSEKQKLKKSHKFSAGKKRVGKRARGKYHKRDKSRRRKKDKSRGSKKDKSRGSKKDKSRRHKKKLKFSAGNKIPATHEETKKLSKAAKAWRKASLECFAEKGKAIMKIKRLTKKLGKCSRNLTLSRELLKVKEKKSRKHKFRNGDGKQKPREMPNLVFNDPKSKDLRQKLQTAYFPITKCYKEKKGGEIGEPDYECIIRANRLNKLLGWGLATKDPGSRR